MHSTIFIHLILLKYKMHDFDTGDFLLLFVVAPLVSL